MDEKFYALNKFEIILLVYDNAKIHDIQNGLIYYFENNEFVRNYHERYLESNINLISNIEGEIQLLKDIRIEGAKHNLDVSSVNIISGKEGKELSNQIVSLSHLREEIKMNQALLKPLVYVQKFANVDQKEDDILTSNTFIKEALQDKVLSGSMEEAELNVEYDKGFKEFAHFSSAEKRIKNFKYKVQLIESYTAESASASTLNQASYDTDKKEFYLSFEHSRNGISDKFHESRIREIFNNSY